MQQENGNWTERGSDVLETSSGTLPRFGNS
jgi:hypothetical protein